MWNRNVKVTTTNNNPHLKDGFNRNWTLCVNISIQIVIEAKVLNELIKSCSHQQHFYPVLSVSIVLIYLIRGIPLSSKLLTFVRSPSPVMGSSFVLFVPFLRQNHLYHSLNVTWHDGWSCSSSRGIEDITNSRWNISCARQRHINTRGM